MNKTYHCQVIEDPDDPEQLLIDLGTEVCAEMGWAVGDTLEWVDNKDGSWTLKKQKTAGHPLQP